MLYTSLYFSSDNPVVWNGTTLYFRGFRILDIVIDAILAVGGEYMEDVILTGCSGNNYCSHSQCANHACV